MKRRREGLGLIWVGDVEQWKLREGSGRADQAGSGQGSAAPQRETLKLGFTRRAAGGGGGKGMYRLRSVVSHFGPPVYVIWPDHFELGRLAH